MDIQKINGTNYLMIKKIEKGRIGDIWLCEDQNNKQIFVLKISKDLPEFEVTDDDIFTTLDDFEDFEIEGCKDLRFLNGRWFPFISKCYASGIIPYQQITVNSLKNSYNEDIAYTLLQYITGNTLGSQQFRSDGSMSMIVNFCSSLLSSLYLLMSNNLTYDDLHSNNIIYNDTVKCFTLVDIGSIATFSSYDEEEKEKTGLKMDHFMRMFVISLSNVANLKTKLKQPSKQVMKSTTDITHILALSQLIVEGSSPLEQFIKQIYSKPLPPKDALILLSSLIGDIPCYLYGLDNVEIYQHGQLTKRNKIPSYQDILNSVDISPDTDLSLQISKIMERFSSKGIILSKQTSIRNYYVLDTSLNLVESKNQYYQSIGKEILSRYGIKSKNYLSPSNVVDMTIDQLFNTVQMSPNIDTSILDRYILQIVSK
jgi:hypothetical protein